MDPCKTNDVAAVDSSVHRRYRNPIGASLQNESPTSLKYCRDSIESRRLTIPSQIPHIPRDVVIWTLHPFSSWPVKLSADSASSCSA